MCYPNRDYSDFFDDDNMEIGTGYPIEIERQGSLYTRILIYGDVSKDNCVMNYVHKNQRKRRSIIG